MRPPFHHFPASCPDLARATGKQATRGAWRRWCAALLGLWLGVAGAAWAQADGDTDPPARVARLSYLAGDVALLPAGAHDWSDADLNRPLTSGDRLSSGNGSRAELELGGAALRIDGQTDLGLLDMDGRIGQFELTQGSLNLEVRRLADGQSYEIDTPTVALVVDQPGTFRVDIDGNGQSTAVTVFAGNAVVFGENDAHQDVVAGRRYRFDNAALQVVRISDIAGGDAFDAWCSDRDRHDNGALAQQYVASDVVGADDLDDYGNWNDDPDYGEVWFPTAVVAGWAPYRFGHWTWIAPWGWTWVDNAPWGFAPFHYGRWAYIRGAWGWVPGPRFARPVYAPALVAFVGGWHGHAGRPVGWFPLGPRDVYNPWYRASHRYYTRLNLGGLRDRFGRSPHGIGPRIERHYGFYRRGRPLPGGGMHHPHGFTAVPAGSFASAGDVHGHALHVDPHQLAGAHVLPHGADVRPLARAPARPAQRPHIAGRPGAGFRRPVVMRHRPASGSFAAARAMPYRNGGAAPFHRAGPPGMASAPMPRAANVRPAGRLPVPAVIRPAAAAGRPLRNGELPSARFVHRPAPGRTGHPGVSFIRRGPDAPASRPAAGTLPRVSRIAPARPGTPGPGGRGQFPPHTANHAFGMPRQGMPAAHFAAPHAPTRPMPQHTFHPPPAFHAPPRTPFNGHAHGAAPSFPHGSGGGHAPHARSAPAPHGGRHR